MSYWNNDSSIYQNSWASNKKIYFGTATQYIYIKWNQYLCSKDVSCLLNRWARQKNSLSLKRKDNNRHVNCWMWVLNPAWVYLIYLDNNWLFFAFFCLFYIKFFMYFFQEEKDKRDLAHKHVNVSTLTTNSQQPTFLSTTQPRYSKVSFECDHCLNSYNSWVRVRVSL